MKKNLSVVLLSPFRVAQFPPFLLWEVVLLRVLLLWTGAAPSLPALCGFFSPLLVGGAGFLILLWAGAALGGLGRLIYRFVSFCFFSVYSCLCPFSCHLPFLSFPCSVCCGLFIFLLFFIFHLIFFSFCICCFLSLDLSFHPFSLHPFLKLSFRVSFHFSHFRCCL